MTAAEHEGSLVHIDCGKVLGTYQGRIVRVDTHKQTITLEHPFWNGRPHHEKKIVLNADDMVDLKILKLAHEFSKPAIISAPKIRPSGLPLNQPMASRMHRPVESTARLRATTSPRKPIAANLGFPNCRSAPRNSRFEPCGIPQLDALYRKPITDRNQHLNAPLDQHLLKTDFDFEANLALFDKQKVLGEIGSSQPLNRDKYRNDENIVSDPKSVYSWVSKTRPQITLIAESTSRPVLYLSSEQKSQLLRKSLHDGSASFAAANVARSAMECVLKQCSVNSETLSVVLVGCSSVSAKVADALCFHLSNRGSRVVLCRVDGSSSPVSAPSLPGVSVARGVNVLPGAASVNLIFNLVHFPYVDDVRVSVPRQWLCSCVKATVLSIDSLVSFVPSERQIVLFSYLPHDSLDLEHLPPAAVFACDLGLRHQHLTEALAVDWRTENIFESHLLVRLIKR